MKMPLWLLVATGGALGSIARWFSEMFLNHITLNWRFAEFGFNYSILIVNVLGSFVIGIIAGLHKHNVQVWSFWATGVLGGFTTFSAMILISYWHLLDRYFGLFILNVSATFIFAFVAVILGIRVAQMKSKS